MKKLPIFLFFALFCFTNTSYAQIYFFTDPAGGCMPAYLSLSEEESNDSIAIFRTDETGCENLYYEITILRADEKPAAAAETFYGFGIITVSSKKDVPGFPVRFFVYKDMDERDRVRFTFNEHPRLNGGWELVETN